MPPDAAPPLNAEQADLVFGPDAVSTPEDQAELKAFLAEALADYHRQLDELDAKQAGLDAPTGARACHALHGSLRTLGLDAAGLGMRELEHHWADQSSDDRAVGIRAVREALERGADALRAAYPFLA